MTLNLETTAIDINHVLLALAAEGVMEVTSNYTLIVIIVLLLAIIVVAAWRQPLPEQCLTVFASKNRTASYEASSSQMRIRYLLPGWSLLHPLVPVYQYPSERAHMD